MKQPKFTHEDIVTNKAGWRRKIVSVIDNYLDTEGRYGYGYLSENYPEKELVFPGMCSEEHLVAWSKK